MTVYEIARKIYENEPSPRTFDEELVAVAGCPNGVVIWKEHLLLMARPVCRQWSYKNITNPYVFCTQHNSGPDCWHVHVLVGTPREAILSAPYPLEWVSFERNNKLRFWKYERLLDYAKQTIPALSGTDTLQGRRLTGPASSTFTSRSVLSGG